MSIIKDLEIQPTEYVDAVNFDRASSTLEVLFNQGPEDWEPSHKLIFMDVVKFDKEVIDDEDQVGIDKFTDLVLEFSESVGDYYLHLTNTVFSFTTKVTPACKYV
ncbi:hypothetical protein [Teredinibacter franksiae]|uniref:hypothetical protein n=1 Tax=Teredinibacter franksiae TaxID=2761453 RepID=UPI001629609E|nr:hypothetical protein [Teredinibacter franksiae]